MKFARQEMRERLAGASAARKRVSSVVIAAAAYFIVDNMVNEDVYAAAGLDPTEAVAAARSNEHHKTLLRHSCSHLMHFLAEVGLLSRPAMRIYRRVNMV